MAIRPIDLQANMSQVTEVGKDAQARTDAIVQQQHVLEKESGEKARLANSKLEESRKGESAVIKDQQKKEEKRREQPEDRQSGGTGRRGKKELSTDDRMGNIIDILK
ncbi:MAG: hypothetical protein JW807_14495 [Spirochaetes bacterium]|nr:hypothetical protein [Spirochaetota bacterium]